MAITDRRRLTVIDLRKILLPSQSTDANSSSFHVLQTVYPFLMALCRVTFFFGLIGSCTYHYVALHSIELVSL